MYDGSKVIENDVTIITCINNKFIVYFVYFTVLTVYF